MSIKDVAEKREVLAAGVYSKYASQAYPVCGFRPMTRSAGRVMACSKHGFSHDRGVIACMNLLKRFVDESSAPWSLKPVNSTPRNNRATGEDAGRGEVPRGDPKQP